VAAGSVTAEMSAGGVSAAARMAASSAAVTSAATATPLGQRQCGTASHQSDHQKGKPSRVSTPHYNTSTICIVNLKDHHDYFGERNTASVPST
jgi:hypothetical protein